MKRHKVFIVSLHKTGTTSLAVFLERLGYLVTGPDTHLFEKSVKNDFYEIEEFLKNYDAFQDDPWYMIYPFLYEKYPNAKFVFLKRDKQGWIKSIQNFYGENRYNNQVRRLFYGSADTLKNKELYLNKYEEHNLKVKEFFNNKKNFIEIDIKQPQDAVRLQKFLGVKVKYESFPHKNKMPITKKERAKKQIRVFILDWFGFKKTFKNLLWRLLSNNTYLSFRTKTRLFRSKLRRIKNKIFV